VKVAHVPDVYHVPALITQPFCAPPLITLIVPLPERAVPVPVVVLVGEVVVPVGEVVVVIVVAVDELVPDFGRYLTIGGISKLQSASEAVA
jgi:hypothetical protein